MKILGLILEINPFHNGHKYFIDQAIKKINPDVIISVVSTSFTMRGDVSCINKFAKTELLLNNGIDIVMELPTAKTLNSADFFGYHTVEILNKMGVTDIVFGLENGASEYLISLLELDKEIERSHSVSNKKSLKIDKLEALKQLTNDPQLLTHYQKPNFTLAISYLKAIEKINPNIRWHAINRTDNFYTDSSIKFKSAFILREMLSNNLAISEYLPYDPKIITSFDETLLFELLKYKFTIERASLIMTKEGIENYICNNFTARNYSELIKNLANKKYTSSRIKRFLISNLLNIPKEYNQFENYYRILGFNSNGRKYISSLNKNTKNSLKTTLKNESSSTALLELQSTRLYSLITHQDLLRYEYQIPIKKGENND